MEQKINSVPSAETNDEVSANVEVSSVSPNNAKPNVGSSFFPHFGLYVAGIDEYRNKPGFNLSQSSEVFVGRVVKCI